MTKDELPDHIQVGIQHFENIPEVEAPVDFHDDGRGAAQFSFHTIVRVRSDGEIATVEERGATLDAAWEAFEATMSKRITEVAISDADALAGNQTESEIGNGEVNRSGRRFALLAAPSLVAVLLTLSVVFLLRKRNRRRRDHYVF